MDQAVLEEEVSLRDEIAAAVDEHEPADSPLQSKNAPEPEGDAAKPAVTPKEPTVAPSAKEIGVPAPAAAVGAPKVGPDGKPIAESAAPALKPPSSWKPQVREKWNTLPREVQEEITRRESDNLRLIGSVGQKIKFADEIGQHLAPFSERLNANGVPPQAFAADVFKSINTLANGSMQDKIEVACNILQTYGIDLRQLDAALTQRLSAPPMDPRVMQAQRAAAQAQSRVQQYESQFQTRAVESANQTLDQFAADPKNEFFDDVRDMMADLLETGRAATLDESYTAACWANPDTRKILLQREAEARASQRGQRAVVARQASSAIAGGIPRGGALMSTAAPEMSLRETIAAAIEEHTP
jgi:hypothetical protein